MSTGRTAARHTSLIVEIRKFIANAIFFNQKVAERFNLNLTDTQCLNLLDLAGSATPRQLADYTGLTTGGITVVLDRLEKAGFIQREPNPKDRRSLIIKPDPSGLARIHAMYAEINKGMGLLMSSFSEKELDVVLAFFNKANETNTHRAS